MAKKELKQQTTQLNTSDGRALKNEASLTYDDNVLPTPQELEAYKHVDPRIVDFLLETAQKEQAFRHDIENKKVKIVGNADSGNRRMDLCGMIFAFLALLALIGLSAFALYLDKPWFAGIFGSGTIITIVSVFVKRNNSSDETNKKK